MTKNYVLNLREGLRNNWLLIVLPIVVFLFFELVLGFNGLYGQDSHEYLRFAKEFKANLLHDSNINEFYWPKGFPILGALISFTGVPELLALRLVSLLAFITTLIVVRKILILLYNKECSWFLVLGAISQVYFMRAGLLVMSDVLSACFIVLSFYSYLKFESTSKGHYLISLILFTSVALYSRYASVPLILLPVLVTLILQLKKYNWWIISLVFIAVCGVFGFVLYSNNHLLEYGINIEDRWNFKNIFSRVLNNADGVSKHLVPNIVYVFGNFLHLGFLSIGVLLIPFYKRLKNANKIISISVVLYFVLLIGLSTQNYRFLVLSHPLVLILLFPSYLDLKNWLNKKKLFTFFAVGVLFFNIGLFYYSFSKTYKVFTVEKEVVDELKKMDENVPIYSFYVDQSFGSYGLNNEVRNFYYEEFDSFEKGALVVFNEDKFKDQWQGKNVMVNWEKLSTNHELEIVAELKENWRIYRIK